MRRETTMTLEPIAPGEAVELYLDDRATELSEATIQSHQYRLDQFVHWCEQQEITNLNNLTGRRLHEFRIWRRKDGDLSTPSEKTQMDTLRVFIRWLEAIDGVEQDLSTKVRSPSLSTGENIRDVMINHEQASAILDYLQTYEYASLQHVTLTLLWRTMMRVGAARSLDVDDFDLDEQFLVVRHRPETGTPIKNQSAGERFVALTEETCRLLTDWIKHQRPAVTDHADRKPLLASQQGRVALSTIRRYCYSYTRPCAVGEECPHDREPDTCEATSRDLESMCPSSVSPHAFRRGSITRALTEDVPSKVVSDRANVSQEVLDDHYDQRSEKVKMDQRREYLQNM